MGVWKLLWGHLGFLTGDLKDEVVFDIIVYFGRGLRIYLESLLKIQLNCVDKKLFPLLSIRMGQSP